MLKPKEQEQQRGGAGGDEDNEIDQDALAYIRAKKHVATL